jgi:1-acyl-sn-glycerol-3-phosphate acyltransferase
MPIMDVIERMSSQPDLALPRWGNRLTQRVGAAVLRAWGWRVTGAVPAVPKLVVVAAPHTSWFDVPLGVAAMLALGIRVHWFAKHTLFWPPLRTLLRWLGGFPVDRAVHGGVTAHVARLMRSRQRFVLALAPEGTRRKVARWRSGFYHIARGAGAAVVPVALDYSRREIAIGPPLAPSGDYDADLAHVKRHFRAEMARHPERYA